MTDGDDTAQSGKYDQTFFLDLAAKGKDAWNAWRRDPTNKDVQATFAGVDFSQPPNDEINFEGVESATSSTVPNADGGGAVTWAKFRESPNQFLHQAEPSSRERASVWPPGLIAPTSVTGLGSLARPSM